MNLPEVCCRCRHLRLRGQFKWGRRFNQRYWVCFSCLQQTIVHRVNRINHESHPESIIRQVLQRCHVRTIAEFELKPGMVFDFAIPRLGLLIEIDSAQFHRTRQQRARDAVKNREAKLDLWAIVRCKNGPDLVNSILNSVQSRREDIGRY